MKDGSKQTAFYKDGVIVGNVVKVFPDGTQYVGEVLNDLPNGQGRMIN